MNVIDAVSVLTEALILVTAGVTLIAWIRQRNWARLDIHFMFAALGGLVLFGQIAPRAGAAAFALRLLALLCFLLQPYLLLRLVLHVRPVGRWVQRSITWGTGIVIASLFVAKRWPGPVRLELLAFFIMAEGYGFVAFLSRAKRTRGAGRWKSLFAAGGTLSLGLMFVAAGIAVYLVPLSKDVKLYTNKFGSLATALLYLLAFATPPFIRRAWGRAELHRFLVRGVAIRASASSVDSLERLCVFARDAVDGICAIAAVWREETSHFAVCAPRQSEFTGARVRLESDALRRAWVQHTPVSLPAGLLTAAGLDCLEDRMGARSALIVPIAAGDWSWGLLIVPMRTDELFVEESLELLQLMAREKAHVVKMQEMADRYSAMAQLAPFAMVMVSAEGRTLQANARTEDFFGYAPEELIGCEIARLLPGLDLGAVDDEAAILTGRRRNGSEFPVSVRRSHLTVEARAVSMLTVQDISARRKAEQAVEERTAQLVAANKELEAFSYSVSHDLRAPLRAVDGFSQILEQDYAAELSSEARHYLQIVRENTRQMGALIDDLLSFSRLSRQPVQKRVVDMDELVARVVEDAQRFEKTRPVRLELGPLPRCEGDAALLRQALVNLISNAFKFSRKAAEPLVAVGCRENEEGTPEYYVKDNGVGFDMAYAPKLFGVFQRLHRAEDYEGTGVGLAIVHRIISRHGGRIWADAKVGQGATFYFTLN